MMKLLFILLLIVIICVNAKQTKSEQKVNNVLNKNINKNTNNKNTNNKNTNNKNNNKDLSIDESIRKLALEYQRAGSFVIAQAIRKDGSHFINRIRMVWSKSALGNVAIAKKYRKKSLEKIGRDDIKASIYHSVLLLSLDDKTTYTLERSSKYGGVNIKKGIDKHYLKETKDTITLLDLSSHISFAGFFATLQMEYGKTKHLFKKFVTNYQAKKMNCQHFTAAVIKALFPDGKAKDVNGKDIVIDLDSLVQDTSILFDQQGFLDKLRKNLVPVTKLNTHQMRFTNALKFQIKRLRNIKRKMRKAKGKLKRKFRKQWKRMLQF